MSTRTVYRDSVEYLTVSVTADVTLDTQAVKISVDGKTTWLTAAWIGTAGTTRSCRVLLDNTNMPPAGERQVFVQVTDTPEIPVFAAAGIARFI
jgi:hypothetical protein